MSHRAVLVLLLLSLSLSFDRAGLSSPVQEIASEPRTGALVIVGGGGTPDEAKRRALELAGGREARVLVLAQASQREESGAAIARMWREAGAGRVAIADLDRAAETLAELDRASLIWFGGGSQNRLMKALDDAGLIEKIRHRHRAGAVVGGTSAGAAVLSDPMLSGKVEGGGIRAGGTDLVPGLGLAEGMIVDQHFLARRRIQRLCAAILDRPELIGVGIDEKTAIIVTGSQFEVLGESGVLVLDPGQAKSVKTEAGAPRAFHDLRLHQLVAGQRFDLEKRRVIGTEAR